jgi:hypothetical protein
MANEKTVVLQVICIAKNKGNCFDRLAFILQNTPGNGRSERPNVHAFEKRKIVFQSISAA